MTCLTTGGKITTLETLLFHYDNTIQYTANFNGFNNKHFQLKFFNYFLIFAQNIDCGTG